MKRPISRLVLPLTLTLGTLGFGLGAVTSPATAASVSHATAASKTWHGKITKLDAKIGTTEAFSMTVDMKGYVVHYDSMTHWVMGKAKDIKVGALVTVTGTLSGKTIAAAKLSA
ncbi:MAG: hypothetical protein WA359_07760 [Acidimicrobiales bacterium]